MKKFIILLWILILVGSGVVCQAYDKKQRDRKEIKVTHIDDIMKPVQTATPEPIETPKPTIKPKAKPKKKKSWQNIGTFKITYYCPCEKCCGHSHGITASGRKATEGRTIGVDKNVIPLGSKVKIGNHIYVAEDTGSFRGQTIDVFVNSHSEALRLGVDYEEVKMWRKKSNSKTKSKNG